VRNYRHTSEITGVIRAVAAQTRPPRLGYTGRTGQLAVRCNTRPPCLIMPEREPTNPASKHWLLAGLAFSFLALPAPPAAKSDEATSRPNLPGGLGSLECIGDYTEPNLNIGLALCGIGIAGPEGRATGVDRVVKREKTQESLRTTVYIDPDFEVRDGLATTYIRVGGQRVVKIESPLFAAAFLPDLSPPGKPDGEVTAACRDGSTLTPRQRSQATATRLSSGLMTALGQ
jgi:hypothetical protein